MFPWWDSVPDFLIHILVLLLRLQPFLFLDLVDFLGHVEHGSLPVLLGGLGGLLCLLCVGLNQFLMTGERDQLLSSS